MSLQKEIERKFLVKKEYFKNIWWNYTGVVILEITQGYLIKNLTKTVRIRKIISNGVINGILGIKIYNDEEIGVDEYEYDVSDKNEIEKLLNSCDKPLIEKTRYVIPIDNHNLRWEIDVFHGHKDGQILAEIELNDINQPFEKPDWIGMEVTGMPEYYNSNM